MPYKQTITFVRHAQSIGNLTGDYSTAIHDNLSPQGQTQALKLAQRLGNFTWDCILVSPLGRTRQTILPYLQQNGLKAQLLPCLAECCYQENTSFGPSPGGWPRDQLVISQHEVEIFGLHRASVEVPSEKETYGDGIQRMQEVIHYLDTYCTKAKSILIVSHGYAISKMHYLLTKQGSLHENLEIENTAMLEVVRSLNL